MSFQIVSTPVVQRDQEMMFPLMSCKDIKLTAVEFVEKLGS